MLFPALACLAFVAILAMAPVFAARNETAAETIRSSSLPALRASQRLIGHLARMETALQRALAEQRFDRLREADAVRDKAVAEFKQLEELNVRDATALARQKKDVVNYYRLARSTIASQIRSARLTSVAGQDMSAQSTRKLKDMTAHHAKVEKALRDAIENDEANIDSAFGAVAAANREAMYGYMSAALVALCLMVWFALRVTRITMDQLGLVSAGFERMAGGDFSEPVEVVLDDEVGELGRQLNTVAGFINRLAGKVLDTAAAINTAASQLATSAQMHQRGASEQSSAVSEIRRTMESTVKTADDVTASAETSLRNAEHTQEKNFVIAGAIQALSAHTDRIGEILENIKDIANKSELLALNAALEGTKAGEAGRGFSLVASQMQRLAENVIAAVGDIRRLTSDIHTSTVSAVGATNEGTELASLTTESARQIRLVMQQHRSSTVLVSQAMDEIVEVAHRSAAHSEQVMGASKDLATLSNELVDTVATIAVGLSKAEEA